MDTIAAIATPPGSGGIGIIRVSGHWAIPIASRLFRRSGNRSTEAIESHRLYHGHILSPASDRIIDEVLLAVMRAPRSYTREDVVEIQAHAGQTGLRAILEAVLAAGARLAEPGEFTRRAFLSGRIDLTQAEAVIDLINARSEQALTAAAGQLHGAMGSHLTAVRAVIRHLLTHIEAAIDFSPDMAGETSPASLTETLEAGAIRPLADLCRGGESARLLRDGFRLAVIGRPNVGKSCLMNALLSTERAIVTPIPGTTRDVIEASFGIDGVAITLLDTAGLHSSDDPVESIGVEKARQSIADADGILLVLDGAEPLTPEDVAAHGLTQDKERIIVTNKWDRVQGVPPLRVPNEWHRSHLVETSALLGDGIDELRGAIHDIAIGRLPDETSMLPNVRQQQQLSLALAALHRAASGISADLPPELIAIDFQEAYRAVGDVIGDTTRPEILDQIFHQFCIGK